MGIMIIATSLDSCEDELNEVVHEWGLVNSKCSINGSNFSSCCLWKASGVNPDSPFVITVPQNITEASGWADAWVPPGGEGGGPGKDTGSPPRLVLLQPIHPLYTLQTNSIRKRGSQIPPSGRWGQSREQECDPAHHFSK